MKQVYKHGDKFYIILRKIPTWKFGIDQNPGNIELVKDYRDWCGADHVLRDQTHFMFCETIQDVEFGEIKIEEDDRETNTVVGV